MICSWLSLLLSLMTEPDSFPVGKVGPHPPFSTIQAGKALDFKALIVAEKRNQLIDDIGNVGRSLMTPLCQRNCVVHNIESFN